MRLQDNQFEETWKRRQQYCTFYTDRFPCYSRVFYNYEMLTPVASCPSFQTGVAQSLSLSEDLVFCGCSDGTVRAFSPVDLCFICTLPRPHRLGSDASALREARWGRDQEETQPFVGRDPLQEQTLWIYSTSCLKWLRFTALKTPKCFQLEPKSIVGFYLK